MDIDDDPFADSFDEDLLRAVEQQESQFFGTALPNDQHVASETETNGESELESLRRQLNQKEHQISEQRTRLEQLRANIKYEAENKLSMERQIAYKDRLIANRDGQLLSARQQIRMLDGKLRMQGRETPHPNQDGDDHPIKESSVPPVESADETQASRKRHHKALPKSMFSTPKNKRPRVQQRSNTPDVDMMNHQLQETHVTSPQSEGPKVDNDKEQLLRRLLCNGDNELNVEMGANLITDIPLLTQLSEAFVKRFTPALDQDTDRRLQDITLILFECLVQTPNVNLSWTVRQLTSTFSQYIMITRERRMIRFLQPAIYSLYTLVRQYDVVKEQLLRALKQAYFPSPEFKSQFEQAYEKREAIANLKNEMLVNMDAYITSYSITLDDLEYDSQKDKMLSHKALRHILGILHETLSSRSPGQAECWYFLRNKAFLSLLYVDRPAAVIQQTLQVVLDQLFACSMSVTFAEQDKTCTPSEVAQSESLVERLSNNGDNFRSVLDNMMDLIKYTCKDETEEGGWESVRLTVVNIIDIAVAADGSSELSDEIQLILVMMSTHLNMEAERATSQTKQLSAKSKVAINLAVTIVYRLFQQTSQEVIEDTLDSVLKESLKKSMVALASIKDQWDAGDADAPPPVDVKMESVVL
ncbi:hypothetical protein Unana1_08376 [Umbelopsis nana]